jgi:putative salt-induced outer membrane protein YdiY
VIETEKTSLALEAGPAYVHADYDDDSDNDEDYSAGRWAVNFRHRLFDDVVRFFHTQEGVVNMDDTDDIYIRSRTGFRIPTYHKINLTLQYNVDWENIPAEGATGTDKKLVTTLGYEW